MCLWMTFLPPSPHTAAVWFPPLSHRGPSGDDGHIDVLSGFVFPHPRERPKHKSKGRTKPFTDIRTFTSQHLGQDSIPDLFVEVISSLHAWVDCAYTFDLVISAQYGRSVDFTSRYIRLGVFRHLEKSKEWHWRLFVHGKYVFHPSLDWLQ